MTSLPSIRRRRCVAGLAGTAMLAAPGWVAAQSPIIVKFSHVVAEKTPKGLGALKFKELAEIARLLGCADDDILRTAIGIAALSGLRFSEISYLHWDDVDFDRRLMTIHRGTRGVIEPRRRHALDACGVALGDALKMWAMRPPGSNRTYPHSPRHE